MAYNTDRLLNVFEERYKYLKKLKQVTYEANTAEFATEYGPVIDEAIEVISGSEDSAKECAEFSVQLAQGVFDAYSKKGKITPTLLMDLNFIMIYYVFPYLLKKQGKAADELAPILKDKWNEILGCNISYTTYEDLYAGFKKRLFGFF